MGHMGSRRLASGFSRCFGYIAREREAVDRLCFCCVLFPRPASPVRFRPSLPGGVDPDDEFVGPPNRLVNILEHGQALCEGGIHIFVNSKCGRFRSLASQSVRMPTATPTRRIPAAYLGRVARGGCLLWPVGGFAGASSHGTIALETGFGACGAGGGAACDLRCERE